jgi:hypothetical protein
MTDDWDEDERERRQRAEEYQRKAAECRSHGHDWRLFDADPYWYDGQTFKCDRCDAVEFRCLGGTLGGTRLYDDPEHDPGFRAVGHEWLLGPEPVAPCGSRRVECVHCHLQYTRWSDVPHEWEYENPDPSLSDPEWAMGVGLVDWAGTRRCIRCGATEYQNPRW